MRGRAELGADACALFLYDDDRARRVAADGFALLPPETLAGGFEAPGLQALTEWAQKVGFRRIELAPLPIDHHVGGLFALFTIAAGDRLGDEDLDTLGRALGNAVRAQRAADELRVAYERRDRSQDQVVRQERMRALGAMALGIAHDFNNVLNGILAQVGVMDLLTTENPELAAAVERLRKIARDGAGTVERVQEFSRQRRDHEFTAVALDRLAGEIVAELRARGTAGIELRARTPAARVRGSAEELSLAVRALVDNALEAMADAGGTLTIDITEEGDEVVLMVADTGHGMSRDVKRRAFDPFFTTKGSRVKGLGLSIAYGVARRHGGRILLDSAPGQGARVRLRLPRFVDEAAPEAPAQTPGSGPAIALPVRTEAAAKRVLLVEDDPDNREAMASLLQLSGYQVTAAESGQAGVRAFSSQPFDLVVTDLGLPDMNGWQVAGEVKASSKTPVALITGWGFNLEPSEIRRRGVDLLIKKPIDPRKFLRSLQTLVG